MLDIRFIKENTEIVKDSIKRRGLDVDIDHLLSLDEARRSAITRMETIQVERNRLAKAANGGQPSKDQIDKGKQLKVQHESVETEHNQINIQYGAILNDIPNIIAEGTPDGGEQNNREERKWGETNLDFEARDHIELGEIHNLFDFEAGAKVAGSKFYFLRDKAVRLWQAIQYATQDIIREQGFELMSVPHLVNSDIAAGTGYMPRGEENQNYVDQDQNLVMIATSEIPLTGYHKDEVIDVTQPLRYAGTSPCYRLEAGTYGKFGKGMYRTHQFEKLEMYIFCKPSESDALLQTILELEERICQNLEIPYRVIRIAAGDLSAPAYEKYDVEYWDPSDKAYRELTSCSNCTDYQSRNLNIKYRDSDGQLGYVHTLNGTAAASSRVLIAVLENHQQADGTVAVPKALQKYYGADTL